MAQLRKIIDRHKKKINTQTPEIDKKKLAPFFGTTCPCNIYLMLVIFYGFFRLKSQTSKNIE